MASGISKSIKRALRMREDMPFSFYAIDFIFRKILRHNVKVPWAIHHTSTIKCPEMLKKGIGVYPGDSPNVYINALNGVEVGDFTNIGPSVSIISANHNLVNNEVYDTAEPIRIGKHCWLGSHAVVLPKVVLGDFTIVGAGAVVTKSFSEGYCVLAGNPAKVIKQLNKEACEQLAAGRK